MFRNFKNVSRFIFGRGCFDQMDDILNEAPLPEAPRAFLVDDVFEGTDLEKRIPARPGDLLRFVNVDDEPKTGRVDAIRDEILEFVASRGGDLPGSVSGIGGGSVMDIAKAVSLMLTNPGSSADYQGWDLIQNPGVYHVGVPTLSGTGAEVSRTTVLTGPDKKLGINSDHTVFDQVALDPDLIGGAPKEQRFYTGMDCFIHCVESLEGSFLNSFSRAYGEKAMDLCRRVFAESDARHDDDLMMASYFGGMSIAYSQVGVCHALSYGLSYVLGLHHGIGNCVAFDCLEDYYPEGVDEFRLMMDRQGISLPRGLVQGMEEDRMEKMIDVALFLEPLWENALGPDWKKKMTRETVRRLYERM
ncbi:3-deoxy-alpha-D-manno-octulosonate 8-oxidase [Candidatus Desulfarcum epimagneticum]|uniref:3-deoxy-alpha-D-manno-octulosonate 8-oxidase n=1 Tax=uncultured Desulfobacteraceae bacterium TaxID=218296 RepID=A0A484HL05_9BACT|nr:3-deoxy-alpha-D-manno-octulosonate 8-oxidase [uncultured Desulfobacteraceae bacterium]